MLLSDYRTRLNQVLKEQAGDLVQADKDAAIENAVKEHSKYRPQNVIADIFGNKVYDLDLPGNWEKNFSKILKVEYPAGEREPIYLDDEDWTIYEDTAHQVLRLLNDTPTPLETVRITYTVRHSVSETSGTVTDGDFEAVCHLAAKYALLSLMNRYLQNTDPALGADSVDHKSKADYARTNANREESEYFQHLGIKPGEVPGGMAFKDQANKYPWGEKRITHPHRWR